jgi:hypothetical protein
MNSERDRRVHELPPRSRSEAFDIPADQLERIIARASVLQHAAGEGEQRRLNEGEILSIGQEVGLSSEHVRRALSEYRAEALSPPEPDDNPVLKRLVGPAFARVRRVVPGSADRLSREIDRMMREQERLRPVRQRGNFSVWEPDQSLGSKITRALDFEGRGYELSELKSLEIAVAAADEESSLVTLSTDLSKGRNEQLQGWGLWAPFVVLILTLTGVLSPWLGVPVLLAGIIAVPAGVRWWLDNRRRRTMLLLEGVLDQVEMRARR